MRVMGIDYGDARTGIAVSDLLCSIVGTTAVIHSRNAEKTIAQICTMVKTSDVGEIVVGLPKNMDGTEGARAELLVGSIGASALRFVCSFLSGVVLWESYAPEEMNVWVYSLVYNGSYMLGNAVVAAVVLFLLCHTLSLCL